MLLFPFFVAAAAAHGKCGSLAPRLPGVPSAKATCDDPIDMYTGTMYNYPSRTEKGDGQVRGLGGPVIPNPSTTCGGHDVVVGWCLADAPMGKQQPPAYTNFTDAECCAACAAAPTCIAWNTNKDQQGTYAGDCHFRSGLGNPDQSPACNFGVVRTPPPPLPPPPHIRPAPAGAKNLLLVVCDDFRPFIKPFTDLYGVKVRTCVRV